MYFNKKKPGSQVRSIILLVMMIVFQLAAANQDTEPYSLNFLDRKLNNYYAQIMIKLSPSAQTKLKTAQRQWIIFRDLDCSWAFNPEPLSCIRNQTQIRIQELEETYFDDKENHYSSIENP